MSTRVLVVDDSPTIRKVVSSVLERHGFEAVEAADGQAALEQLVHAARPNGNGSNGDGADEAEKIDVVLVDFVMPRMNGFQLCRAIRHDELLRDTPIVLMSAKSDRIRDHFVQQTGAIDAITKPFEAQALIAVIENAIRRSAEWRERERAKRENRERAAADEVDAADSLAPSPDRQPVALQGDIAVIPIGAILQLLQIESRSGLLLVTDDKIEVTMSVRLGLIDLVQARGAGTEFRLGRYFIEHNLVTDDDIDRLLRDNTPTPRPPPPESGSRSAMPKVEPLTAGRRLLGDLLVDSGRVTRDQLRDALARQSSELVYEVLRWPRGRFEFRLDSLPALAESAKLGLPVASVVMEGFRRVDEWRVVEAGLGSFESVLQADRVAIDAAKLDRLTKHEQRLLEMIDGDRTVREIIEHSHMSSFDACKVLYALLEARLVRRRAA
ncbi:MAG TPA: response regulator [Polyangiaceae bacterium]|jgi:CheY-like chemotaxis protein|nr:response regulator [Polyangiaceae bacterium]